MPLAAVSRLPRAPEGRPFALSGRPRCRKLQATGLTSEKGGTFRLSCWTADSSFLARPCGPAQQSSDRRRPALSSPAPEDAGASIRAVSSFAPLPSPGPAVPSPPDRPAACTSGARGATRHKGLGNKARESERSDAGESEGERPLSHRRIAIAKSVNGLCYRNTSSGRCRSRPGGSGARASRCCRYTWRWCSAATG